MSSYKNAIIKVGQSLLLDMGEPNKPGGKASKVFPQRRSACMQRFPGAAESDTGCSDPELCERCSAECGNEHAAECSRVRQSAAGSAVAAAVVQQSWVQPAAAAAAGLRPRCRVRLVAAAAHFAASEARLGWVWPLWPQTEAAGGLHCIPPAATAGLQPLLQRTTHHAPLLCCTGWPPTVEVYVLILVNPKGRHKGTERNNLPC